MRRVKYISLVFTITILLLVSDEIRANAIEKKSGQEILCYKESSYNAMVDFPYLTNIMPNKKGLKVDFSRINARAVIFINNIQVGRTDDKGNLSPGIEFPLDPGKIKLLIKIHDSIIHQCEFSLNQDSELECTGTNNFKCILY